MINDCYVKEEHENGLLSCYLNLTSVSYSVELRWYGLPLLTMCEDQVRQSSQWLLIPVKEAVSWSSMSSTGKPHSPASLLLAVAVGLTSSCKHLNRSDTCHFHAKPMIRCRHVPSCLCPSGNSMTRTDLWRGTVLQMAEWPTARVLEGFCIATQDHSPWTAMWTRNKLLFYLENNILSFLHHRLLTHLSHFSYITNVHSIQPRFYCGDDCDPGRLSDHDTSVQASLW